MEKDDRIPLHYGFDPKGGRIAWEQDRSRLCLWKEEGEGFKPNRQTASKQGLLQEAVGMSRNNWQ